MLILIAESKTMSTKEVAVASPTFPEGEAGADMICQRLASCSVSEISEMLKVSSSLATSCLKMAKEFPNKTMGLRAIDAYTGVVFKALDAKTFTPQMDAFAENHLLIVSSLYSLLKPTDTIKPYRLDYTSKAAPDDMPMWRWQREATTQRLIERIKAEGETELLNLLPGDAAKCIDWHRIQPFANIITADFKELTPGGTTKTPTSNRLKQLRGHLCLQIIEAQISDVQRLKEVESDAFAFDPDASTSSTYTFLA